MGDCEDDDWFVVGEKPQEKRNTDGDDWVLVDSPVSSSPVSCSIKVVPQITVGSAATDLSSSLPKKTSGTKEFIKEKLSAIKSRSRSSSKSSEDAIIFPVSVPSPQKEGFSNPHYREEWGADNDCVGYAWSEVPSVTSVTFCRTQINVLIRRGVPDNRRRTVWMAAAGVQEFLLRWPRVFEIAFQSTFGAMGIPTEFAVVPLFGAPKLPTDNMCLSPEGVHAAKAILCMVANKHSELLCCPRLPTVILILLHFMDIYDTFVTVEAMLQHTADWRDHGSSDGYDETALPYFDISGSEVEAFNRSFASLLSSQIGAKMSRTIERIDLDVSSQIAPMMFDTLFADVFPFGLVVRIMDCFMNEGSTVLLRVALALFSQYKNVLYNAASADDFVQRLLQGSMQQSVRDARIMKDAFRLRLSEARTTRLKREQQEIAAQEITPDDHCQKVYYRPKMSKPSSVITSAILLENLWGLLPRPLAITDPVIVYQAERDGFNLRRMMENTSDVAPCMVIVRTNKNSIAGFYSSIPLSEAFKKKRGSSFGDGETFVFSLTPTPRKYTWDEKGPDSNSAFLVYDDAGSLHVGAGRTGAALSFTEDLFVDSNPCDTFASPVLFAEQLTESASSSSQSVVCVSLEVFAFE